MSSDKVSLDLTSQDQGVVSSGRWADGKTRVVLAPFSPLMKHKPGLGKWDTERGSDIDSSGGSEWAVYRQDGADIVLAVVLTGDEHPDKVKIHNFDGQGGKGKRGTGEFWFRDAWTAFTWKEYFGSVFHPQGEEVKER